MREVGGGGKVNEARRTGVERVCQSGGVEGEAETGEGWEGGEGMEQEVGECGRCP